MRFIAHGMHPARVDPPVIEVKKRANRQRVIDGFVCVAVGVQGFYIARPDGDRVLIDLADKPQECFLSVRQRSSFNILQDALDQIFTTQKFRRDRGVGFRSKRAVIEMGSVGGNQLTKSGCKRCRFTHDLLRKAFQMRCRFAFESKHMQDLRIFGPGAAHRFDPTAVVVIAPVLFNILQKHGIHEYVASKTA